MKTSDETESVQSPVADESFHIIDAASANWVVRKIVEAHRYAERVRQWASAELRRAEREEQFLLTRFGSELEQWCRRQVDGRGNRRRCVDLPAGRIGFRRTPYRSASIPICA